MSRLTPEERRKLDFIYQQEMAEAAGGCCGLIVGALLLFGACWGVG